jgi:ankyrin repeat protein
MHRATNIVPEAFGTAIPSSPAELLKFIQHQQHVKAHESQNTENGDIYQERIRKQEAERENYESFQMEREDIFSENLIALFKEYDSKRLQEKIRKDIELRQAQEKAEREERRKQAEERRKAVVERIRRQKELEEERKREAELQIQRIEEEKLRKIQEEKDKFIANQNQMLLEDQFSMLVEQEYRELLERKFWQQKERERLLEWEKEQKRKDQIEEEARKARMKELEEKKRKLELLRQQQQQTQQTNGSDTLKDQGEKLNKQLRIQNRAKFVSKKIATSSAAATSSAIISEPIVEVIDHNSSASKINNLFAPAIGSAISSKVNTSRGAPEGHTAMKLHRNASRMNLDAVIFQKENNILPLSNSASTHVLHRQSSIKVSSSQHLHQQQFDEATKKELDEYQKEISAIDDELKLKQIQSDLMIHKRELRLEQRQKLSHKIDDGSNSAVPSDQHHMTSLTATMNDSMKHKLTILSEKMTIVEKQLAEVLIHKNKSKIQNVEDESSKLVRQKSMKLTVSSHDVRSERKENMILGIAERAEKEMNSIKEEENESPLKPHHQQQQQQDSAEVFKHYETTLRNGNKCIASHSHLIADDLGSIKPSAITDAVHEMSSITFEILKHLQSIQKDYDPLGYSDKLHQMNESLKTQIEQLQEREMLRKERESILGKISPRPTSASSGKYRPVRIYSKTNMTAESKDNVVSPRDSNTAKPSFVESKTDGLLPSAKDNKLLSSFSEPVLPGVTPAAEEKSSRIKEESNEKVVSVTDENINEVTTLPPRHGEEEKKGGDDSEINPAELPGWEECIYTSMFSAAHHAAFFGYYEVLKFLCKCFDCFIMDKKSRTPLFYASLNNRLDCVALLVELDPQWIDVGDEKGDTALHAAAISNSIQVLAFLLSCEAHPDTANYSGLTPSHLGRSKEALALLRDSNAQQYCVDNLSRTPLWYACSDGRLDCCEYLCEQTPAEFLLWKDNDGETGLHVAASKGHFQCIDMICQFILTLEELNCVNNRKYTAAHLAANAHVLQILYENGANLWLPDENKGRMPLFIASFFGRADCVSFLLDLANKKQMTMATIPLDTNRKKSTRFSNNNITAGGSSSSSSSHPPLSHQDSVSFQDKAGDTALHVAALCGHMNCVYLLLFYMSNQIRNKQNLLPSDLASKANHQQIGKLIEDIDGMKSQNKPYLDVFGTEDFHYFSSILLYYGSRWGKSYDLNFQTYYYIDYVTNQSQWERPELIDLPQKAEDEYTKASDLLFQFYSKYNPTKVSEINMILFNYRNQYSDLFITLANKYQIQDLSMFAGINFVK